MEDPRVQAVEFIGVQYAGQQEFAMFNDPVTGTTFCVRRGETIGQAIERVRARYRYTSDER